MLYIVAVDVLANVKLCTFSAVYASNKISWKRPSTLNHLQTKCSLQLSLPDRCTGLPTKYLNYSYLHLYGECKLQATCDVDGFQYVYNSVIDEMLNILTKFSMVLQDVASWLSIALLSFSIFSIDLHVCMLIWMAKFVCVQFKIHVIFNGIFLHVWVTHCLYFTC